MLELFPETKLGHGPPTDTGFFYDFYRPTPFTPEDLQKIEKKMQELVQQDIPYAREFLPRNEGLAKFKGEGDFMRATSSSSSPSPMKGFRSIRPASFWISAAARISLRPERSRRSSC